MTHVARSRRSPRATATILAVALSTALTVAGAGPALAAQPDLIVYQVSNPPKAAIKKQTIVLSDTTLNIGKVKSGPFVTRYYLSKDQKRNGKDLVLATRKIAELKAKRWSIREIGARIPRTTPSGRYFVIACADAKKQVKESKEGNNCKASKSKMQVGALKPPTKFGKIEAPFGAATPVDVSPTIDSEESVSGKITPEEGGKLDLTAPDGTTFSLTFPKGAVLSNKTITMTLVTDVSDEGLPGGNFVTGVKLGPEGLRLFKPAKLVIEPTAAITPEEETSFSADGDGTDFHLYPLRIDPATTTFDVTHFSLFGLFKSDAERRSEQVQRQAADAEDALSQKAQEILSEERRRQLLGEDESEGWSEELSKLTRIYYDRVVRPLMFLAQTDEKLFFKAVQKWLSWERQVQLLGMESILTPLEWAELRAMFEKGFANYVNKTYERCVRDKDLAVVPELLALARMAELLEIGTSDGIIEKVRKCATFEVLFESRIETTCENCFIFFYEYDGHDIYKVRSVAKFRVFDEAVGNDPIAHTLYSSTAQVTMHFGKEPMTCTSKGSGVGMTIPSNLRVHDLGLDMDFVEKEEGKFAVDKIDVQRLLINPGTPQEKRNLKCDDGSTDKEVLTLWLSDWRQHHESVYDEDSGKTSYVIDGWVTGSVGSDPIAETTIDHTETHNDLGGTYHSVENTVAELRHKPG